MRFLNDLSLILFLEISQEIWRRTGYKPLGGEVNDVNVQAELPGKGMNQ